MVQIRQATIEDLHQMQTCNVWNLPENYTFKYYFYHYLSWSELLFVADDNGSIVGYVLAKLENEEDPDTIHGHITSISVLRSHRRLGIATKLLEASHQQMKDVFKVNFCSLHVRISNRAAIGLYEKKLGYIINSVEEKYYADGEDALDMQKYLKEEYKNKQLEKKKNEKTKESDSDKDKKTEKSEEKKTQEQDGNSQQTEKTEQKQEENAQDKKKKKKKKK